MSGVKDMTVGNPGGIIFKFALPLMLGNMFQQIYTFVDTVVVGRVLGMNALAALGVTEWVIFFMFAAIQGIVQGFSIMIAQYFGAGNYKKLRSAVYSGLCLSLVLMVGMTVAGQLIIQPVLRLLQTPGEVMGYAVDYLQLLYMGIPFTFLYNYQAAIFRAIGNSKIPLQAIALSSIQNIILDLLFVSVFKWGIKGAAVATLLSMLTSVLYCFIKIRQFEILHIRKDERLIQYDIIAEQLKLGIPMGLQNIFTSIGGLIVQSVINGFGVIFIAGYTAANKLYGLLEIAASSYGYAMNTFVGQNKGAGKNERLRQGLRSGNIVGIITACAMSAIMLLFGRTILECFLSGNIEQVNDAIHKGYQFLIILSVFFPCLYMLYITRAWIQGMGNSTWPMISSIMQLIMRVSCALILTKFIGENAVYWGEIAAWAGADILLFIICRRLIKEQPSPKNRVENH